MIFDLDNTSRTIIQESVVVRNVRGDGVVGTEFVSAESVDRAIGAYMADEKVEGRRQKAEGGEHRAEG